MRLLPLIDQLFLMLESREQPMHVGGLFIFELPKNADENFVHTLVQQMQTSKVPPTFPFNQVLHNLMFWKTDENFEVEHHFRHIALPKPAHLNDLYSYISKEHSRLLDKARPLWECHIIEGIEPTNDNNIARFALYFKIHHSLVDGVAAMRLIQKSLSQSPKEVINLPLWSMMLRHRHQIETMLPKNRSALNIVKEQLLTIKPVFSELLRNVVHATDSNVVSTNQAPSCILNRRISSSRRFSAKSYAMSKFKRISNQLNVSINDVVLAVCAGALRKYLLLLKELPIEKPLIAWVPYSMRTDKTISGNQFAFILCNLGTHLEQPLQRLRTIHNSMNEGKKRFGRMSQAQVINYSLATYSWEFINILTNAYPKKQAFNLIISNVPGSKKPLYCNGAKLTALYPASIVFNGQALNITLASYLDSIEFGILACSKTLPKVNNLLIYLEEELALFEKICDEQDSGIRD